MKFFRLVLLPGIFFGLHFTSIAQERFYPQKSDAIDSFNQNVTAKIIQLLKEKNPNEATAYFRFGSDDQKRMITSQLKKISIELQPIKAKTKELLQTSFKDYKDSFNMSQVIFYNNEEGPFYLIEFFFLKNDSSFKVVNIWVKDPAALAKKRKELTEYKKKNPGLHPPPQHLPPGVFMKEN